MKGRQLNFVMIELLSEELRDKFLQAANWSQRKVTLYNCPQYFLAMTSQAGDKQCLLQRHHSYDAVCKSSSHSLLRRTKH